MKKENLPQSQCTKKYKPNLVSLIGNSGTIWPEEWLCPRCHREIYIMLGYMFLQSKTKKKSNRNKQMSNTHSSIRFLKHKISLVSIIQSENKGSLIWSENRIHLFPVYEDTLCFQGQILPSNNRKGKKHCKKIGWGHKEVSLL